MNMDSKWSKQKSLFCMYESVVACCQSQHQYHFWRMNSIDVGSVLHGHVSLAAVSYMYVFYEVMNGRKNLKIH